MKADEEVEDVSDESLEDVEGDVCEALREVVQLAVHERGVRPGTLRQWFEVVLAEEVGS